MAIKKADSAGDLIGAARQAREHAQARFSGFKVGAALRCSNGRVYTGCNIENATYGLTICAERVAIFKALSEGENPKSFAAMAIVADSGSLSPPCGACRQIIWEFCGDIPLTLADLKGKSESHRVAELLPKPFDASFL